MKKKVIPNTFLIKLKNKNFENYNKDCKNALLIKEKFGKFPTETVYDLELLE